MTDKKNVDNVKVTISGLELFSFFGIEATRYKPKDSLTFSSKFTFDKSSKNDMEQLAILRKAVVRACAQEWGNNFKKVMKNPEFQHGIRDPITCKHLKDKITGEDKPAVEQLKGKMFFGAKANENRRQGFGVLKSGKLVEIEDDKVIAKYFYSGAIVQLSMSIFCYEVPTVGYSFWMDGIVLEAKGKRTFGRPDISQSFDLKKLLTTVVDVDADDESGEGESESDTGTYDTDDDEILF